MAATRLAGFFCDFANGDARREISYKTHRTVAETTAQSAMLKNV
jgi:hypothetical protein